MTKSLAARLASTPPRAMYYDGAYAPFGEPYAQNGTADLSFTGMNQDTVANLYDFPVREYGTQGRWPSPDPADLAAADPTDPQSWNRYAYVRNSPLNLIDPLGLALVPVGRGSDYPLNCLVDNVTDVVWCPGLFAGGGRVLLKPYQSAPNEGGGGAGAPQAPKQNNHTARNQCVQSFGAVKSIADTLGVWGLGSAVFAAGSSALTSGMQLVYGTTAKNIAQTVAAQPPSATTEGILATMGENASWWEGSLGTFGKVSLAVTAGATAVSAGIRAYCAAKTNDWSPF